jgi:hypothetical protein
VLAASLLLLSIVAGLALASYGFVRAKSGRNLANTARIEAQMQRDIAIRREELGDHLGTLDDERWRVL